MSWPTQHVDHQRAPVPLSGAEIFRLWWPLAASWMLMGLEIPLFASVVARMPHPEINLAAHGGVVFPVALAIESPIMMLLVASTALARDLQSFRLIRRFMLGAGLVLTAVHALVAFTPLYDLVAARLLGAPRETLAAGRVGLALMLPWSGSIAYRRFYQGVLIRHDRSRPIVIGTLLRLGANVVVLAVGSSVGSYSGIAIGAAGISAGVLVEAAFIGACTRSIVRGPLRHAAAVDPPLTFADFLRFYAPLALTQALSLSIPPLTAAAVSRMPLALTSLAAWPPAMSLSFVLRGSAFAFHEVVVSLLSRPAATAVLRRFAHGIAIVTGTASLVLGATPLGDLWFAGVLGLPPNVAHLARLGTLAGALLPPITAMENWWQGRLVHAHRTRSVTVGTAIYLFGTALLLAIAVTAAPWPGIITSTIAVTLASAAKAVWLAKRARASALPDSTVRV